MATSLIGLVYYTDDPHKRVFRVIYPTHDDSELDQPPTDGNGLTIRSSSGQPHTWTSMGTDSARPVAMDKVAVASGRKHGTPFTPATEPVVYYIGIDLIGTLSVNIGAQVDSFIAVHPEWSNLIDLGSGDATQIIATVQLVSPFWVVTVDGDLSATLGVPTRTRSFSGHTISIWQG